jgi:hypothetical protein
MRSTGSLRLCVILALFGSLLGWAGKEPWLEKKPYTEWTENDVRAILTQSPWVASQIFMIYGRQDEPASREFGPLQPQGVAVGGAVGSGTDRIGQVRSTADSPLDHQVFVSVIWASSLTLRQATVRMTQLRGAAPAGDPEQYLAQTPPYYEVVVTETPWSQSKMTKADLFNDFTEADLKQRVYIETMPGGQKVPPERAQSAPGRAFPTTKLYFPREVGGKPLLTANDSGVRFFFKTRRGDLKAEFNLRAMVRNGQPDF